MNKTPIITIVALLTVILIAFSGCEVSVDLNKDDTTETSVETVVVTDEEGSTHLETVIHQVTTEEVPVVTVVEVTDKKGEVVATEKVTLSKEEVQAGKDFFTPTTTDKEISKEPASERVTTPSEEETVQDDIAVLNSNKYMVVGRAVSGETSFPYKIARDGNKCSMTTIYNEQEVCIIIGAEYVYYIVPESESYVKIARSLAESEASGDAQLEEVLSGNGINLYANKTKVSTTTEKIDGIKYTLIEYDDGTVDYLNGKTLVKTTAQDGSVLYYDTITTEVSQGVFLPPAGFKEQVIDPDGTTTAADSADSSDNYSND